MNTSLNSDGAPTRSYHGNSLNGLQIGNVASYFSNFDENAYVFDGVKVEVTRLIL